MLDSLAKQNEPIVFPFTPQERQAQAAAALAPFETTKINGYGGPKFGGKSWTIQYLSSIHALSRPVMILVIGHKFEDMKALHIEPLERYLEDYINANQVTKYHSTNKQFKVKRWNSVIKFQQVTRDADAKSLNGQAWDIVLIDEAQKLSPFCLSYLQGICRISHTQSNWRTKLKALHKKAKKKGDAKEMARLKNLWYDTYYIPKLLYCFNWGEKGHSWLKRIFWDGCAHEGDPYQRLEKFMKDQKTDRWIENPDDYRFIFAPMEENQRGLREDPGYVNRIKSMEEPYRTAYLTGDPNAFAGLMFEIHPHIHEVDMDTLLVESGYHRDGHPYIPDHWRLIGAIDPGTQDFCSAAMYALTPEGISYQLTDYYVKGRNHEENAEEIVNDWERCYWTKGRMPDYVVAGKDAFARQSKNAIRGHEVTLADVYWNKYRIHLTPAITDRVAGAQALQMVLSYKSDDTGSITKPPKLYFAKRKTGYKDKQGYDMYKRICEPTITEIVGLESNPKRPEDIKQEGVPDHAYDRTKYYLLSLNSPPQLPVGKRKQDQLPDYGKEEEYMESINDSDSEDISSFGMGGIGD